MRVNLDTLKQRFDRVTIKHISPIYTKGGRVKKKGRTIAVITDKKECFVGISECSRLDQFSRKSGRIIALSRALHVRDIVSGKDNRKTNISTGKFLFFPLNAIPQHVLETVPAHLYEVRALTAGK